MSTKNWNPLYTGDIIDVVAPGFASTEAEVEGARQFLLNWGFKPRIPKGLIQKHFLHSNSDEKRFHHLKNAFLAEDSKAIWCLRGGYGANRLLPFLDKLKVPKKNKLFLGISDVTSLHIYLNQKWNWSTLHAPLLDRLGQKKVPQIIEREIFQTLTGKIEQISYKKIKPMNSYAKNIKAIKAPIVGGNLTVIQSTLGTPYQINLKNKFLFVEDLGERGYRVDRIFEHLYQSNALKGCKGVLIGEFIGGVEPDGKTILWPLVFKRWAEDSKIPFFSGIEVGHGVSQRPLPLNTMATIKQKNKFTMTIETGILGE